MPGVHVLSRFVQKSLWHTAVIPVLGRMQKEDYKFKASTRQNTVKASPACLLLFTCVCVHVPEYRYVYILCVCVCVCRSEDKFQKSVLSFLGELQGLDCVASTLPIVPQVPL